MSGANLPLDLVSYCAQVACLTALGSLVPVLLRVQSSELRYAYFRALLALCLILPWLQNRPVFEVAVSPSRDPSIAALAGGVAGVAPAAAMAASGGSLSAVAVSWWPLVAAVIGLGCLVRMLWIGAGLRRLRRLRRSADAGAERVEGDDLQQVIGTRATIQYASEISQPVTFGFFRPIVLLPGRLREMPVHVQRAVLSHELFHVRRRDWAWLLGEELVRAALWFHPGVWWLVSRVQQAREEVVDELAVQAIGTRRGYVEALMAFAEEKPSLPAAALARRRHLFQRLSLISRERAMSMKRIVISGALMLVAIAAASRYAIDAFPLAPVTAVAAAQTPAPAPGPLEAAVRPITPENPVPRRLSGSNPRYPAGMSPAGNAAVRLLLTVDATGRVAEARGLEMPVVDVRARALRRPEPDPSHDALVQTAIETVRQWRYDPPAEAPIAIEVGFRFEPGREAILTTYEGRSPRMMPARFVVRQERGVDRRVVPMPPPPPPPPSPGSPNRLTFQQRGGVDRRVVPLPPPPPPPPPLPPGWQGALRVGDGVQMPALLRRVEPKYPAIARAARKEGVIWLQVMIGSDGRVAGAQVVRSIPLLNQAALDAVQQWEFAPAISQGQAVPVIADVEVSFTLPR